MMISCIEERLKNKKFVLVAEIGVNYYDIAQKMDMSLIDAAKFMVTSAKNAGVHAVKFQTYKADSLAVRKSPAYWDLNEEPTKTQYELFKKYDEFGEHEYRELHDFCEKIGIEFFSTPFNDDAVEYLDDIMNVYKISSSDLNNLLFVEHVAKKNKPIILSVGASDKNEIKKAIKVIEKYNDKKITLLHCVLEYPTPYCDANLNKIIGLKESFPDCNVGYSDHTKPDLCYDVIKVAYLLGANIVEKHFTVDKKILGNDHYHAMDQYDAENIIKSIEFIDLLRGNEKIVCLDGEKKARQNARRSIVSKRFINKGEVITKDMLICKRPGIGISPALIDLVVGKKAVVDILEDEIISKNMISR